MANLSLQFLFGTLGVLLMLSAFFSGSETALMTLNRYRLRHLSKAGHRGAQLAEKLLQRPDRLIGLILLGNNFVNIAASSLATVIALRLGGEGAIAVAAGLLTLVVLIFAEVLPKTLAALRPELLAFPAAWVYTPLQKVAYPVVWMINIVANGLLRVFGVRTDAAEMGHLSTEELRTVVIEAGAMIPKRHQKMLLSVLDLQKVTVEDIMVPRAEILGIDLAEDWDEILTQLLEMQHTRLPVWEDDIDNVVGVIHLLFPEPDGTFLVNGTATVRQLNRTLNTHFRTDGPKTLNGLVFEHMESIPDTATSMLIDGYPVEIIAVSGNQVKTARVRPWRVQKPVEAET
ncbi:MAG: CNNM domain-containing protein [Xanthomonadaceae bacterium]|nr:CNNM domain-containing protein [Xanthomonadaceae bacterium]